MSAPTGVSASDSTYTDRVEVTWNVSTGAVSYDLYRSTTNTGCASLFASSITTTAYSDSGVTPGTIYYYSLKSRGVSGHMSTCSAVNPGNAVVAPNAPTNIQATDGDFTDRIQLSWNGVSGASSYYIYLSTSNFGCSALLTSGISSTTYPDYSVIPGQRYYYSLKTRDPAGNLSVCSAINLGYRRLLDPSGLVASNGDFSDKIQVSWNSVEGAIGYRIYRSASNSACGTFLTEIGAQTTYDDSSAITAQSYFYSVEARGQNTVVSGYSNVDLGYRTLPGPLNVAATDGSFTDRIDVSWAAVSGTTGYNLYRSRDGSACSSLLATSLSGTSYSDPATTPGQRYYYSLRTRDSASHLGPCSSVNLGYRALLAPTGFSASNALHSDRVRLSWNTVSGAVSYRIYRSSSNTACGTFLTEISASTSYDDTSVTPGVTFYYSVAARGQNTVVGPCSVSDEGYATVLPPTSVSASDGTYTDKVRVTWPAASGAVTYNIYRSTTNVGAARY